MLLLTLWLLACVYALVQHYSDGESKGLLSKFDKVYAELKARAAELSPEDRDNLRALKSDVNGIQSMGELDSGAMPDTPQVEGWRAQRDLRLTEIEAVIGQADAFKNSVPIDHGTPTITRSRVMNPDELGDRYVDLTYGDGHTESVIQPREATDTAIAQGKAWSDERADIRLDLAQVKQLRSAALALGNTKYKEEADALEKKSQDRLSALKSDIAGTMRAAGLNENDVAAEVRSYELHFSTVDPAVESVADLLAAGKTGEAVDAFMELSEEQRHSPTFEERVGEKGLAELGAHAESKE